MHTSKSVVMEIVIHYISFEKLKHVIHHDPLNTKLRRGSKDPECSISSWT